MRLAALGKAATIKAFAKNRERRKSGKTVCPEARAFLWIALIGGLIILLLTPPLTAPDEQAHFTTIWPIAHGQPLARPDADGRLYRTLPVEWISYLEEYPDRLLGVDNTEKFTIEDFKYGLLQRQASLPTEPIYVAGVSMGYLFSAAGMKAAAFLGTRVGIPYLNSILGQILVGRFCNLMVYTALIYLAIRRAPHFRRTMLLLGCMPMSLYLGCSLNYDAILIPVAVYFVSLILALCREPEKRLTTGEILQVCGCTFLLTGIKYAYAPLLLMLLAIPRSKYGSPRRMAQCICAAVVSGALGFVPSWLQNSLGIVMTPTANMAASAAAEQVTFLKTHVTYIPRLVLNTVGARGASYIKSFWGCLGWLDVHIPTWLMVPGVILLTGSGIQESFTYDGWTGQRWKNLLPLAAAGITIAGIAAVMYVEHTTLFHPVGNPIIEGIQGRYFIPLFLPILLGISNRSLAPYFRGKGSRAEGPMTFTAILWSGCCAMITIGTLLTRYWIR